MSRRPDGVEHERFLAPSEAADLFGVDPKTLARWEKEGKLSAMRTSGGHRRYRYSDLQQAMHRPSPAPQRAPDPSPVTPASEQVTRAAARRRALEVLHAADVAGSDPRAGLGADDASFAWALAEGVAEHGAELDEIIRGAAEHWTIERMPVVDRNVLRIAVYELVHTDTPTGVIVDQAVSLAKLLSTEESGRFVNGILGRIARQQRA